MKEIFCPGQIRSIKTDCLWIFLFGFQEVQEICLELVWDENKSISGATCSDTICRNAMFNSHSMSEMILRDIFINLFIFTRLNVGGKELTKSLFAPLPFESGKVI